jgi:hypothetical protein
MTGNCHGQRFREKLPVSPNAERLVSGPPAHFEHVMLPGEHEMIWEIERVGITLRRHVCAVTGYEQQLAAWAEPVAQRREELGRRSQMGEDVHEREIIVLRFCMLEVLPNVKAQCDRSCRLGAAGFYAVHCRFCREQPPKG